MECLSSVSRRFKASFHESSLQRFADRSVERTAFEAVPDDFATSADDERRWVSWDFERVCCLAGPVSDRPGNVQRTYKLIDLPKVGLRFIRQCNECDASICILIVDLN